MSVDCMRGLVAMSALLAGACASFGEDSGSATERDAARSDAAAPDAGAPTTCPAGALVCDDFERDVVARDDWAVDRAGSDGRLEIESVGGSRALRAQFGAKGRSTIGVYDRIALTQTVAIPRRFEVRFTMALEAPTAIAGYFQVMDMTLEASGSRRGSIFIAVDLGGNATGSVFAQHTNAGETFTAQTPGLGVTDGARHQVNLFVDLDALTVTPISDDVKLEPVTLAPIFAEATELRVGVGITGASAVDRAKLDLDDYAVIAR